MSNMSTQLKMIFVNALKLAYEKGNLKKLPNDPDKFAEFVYWYASKNKSESCFYLDEVTTDKLIDDFNNQIGVFKEYEERNLSKNTKTVVSNEDKDSDEESSEEPVKKTRKPRTPKKQENKEDVVKSVQDDFLW